MKPKNYRPDIDGLRALAILPVLLYHAGVPGFSGGFIGVDVFFVISGFLITSILVREIEAGTYSIGTFYERRIRRIFPALLVVVLTTVLIAPFVLLPSELARIPKEALSSLFFVANIALWRDSGYFAPDAETRPFLHMWSLGVEEQFYLFCPVALWLVFKYAYRWRAIVVGAGMFASLALCVWLTPVKPGASFYLIPTRAWELLAGSLLAMVSIRQALDGREMRFGNVLAAAGLLAIVVPVHLYSGDTSFPGYAAVLPVLGSFLIIRYGPFTVVGKMLSLRPMVFIGGISYSLYLWHWPVMVFGRALQVLETPLGKIIAITISVLLAWISLVLIETPSRNRQTFPARHLLPVCTVATVAIAILSVAYVRIPSWDDRVPHQVLLFDEARNDVSPKRDSCHVSSGLPSPESACVLGGTVPEGAVWGDSHGVELAYALGEAGLPLRQLTYSSCFPALGWSGPTNRPLCGKHNEQVATYLASDPAIRYVVMVGYYGSAIARDPDLLEKFDATAAVLARAGKRVIVVGPTPYISNEVNLPSHLARGGERYVPYQRELMDVFRKRMSAHAEVVMPTDRLCDGEKCDLIFDGAPLLFDAHHPTVRTSRITAAAIKETLAAHAVASKSDVSSEPPASQPASM